jgi:hypothetical protein
MIDRTVKQKWLTELLCGDCCGQFSSIGVLCNHAINPLSASM